MTNSSNKLSKVGWPTLNDHHEIMTIPGYDIDGDGKVSLPEFKRILMKTGKLSPEDIEKLIERADVDNDGFIDFGEFKKMMTK